MQNNKGNLTNVTYSPKLAYYTQKSQGLQWITDNFLQPVDVKLKLKDVIVSQEKIGGFLRCTVDEENKIIFLF